MGRLDEAPVAKPMSTQPGQATQERDVEIPARGATLAGTLTLPTGARGVVVFAHGSGSGRFSPRNRAVAAVLVEAGLATLLMDLLTADEEAEDMRTGHLRFDIPLLAERVASAVDWLSSRPSIAALPVGCFGASTGAAAALVTATERPHRVRAVVSRGGRPAPPPSAPPPLPPPPLRRVEAPTLLIVGGRDTVVIQLNRQAQALLRGESELVIVPGASHLFEEPGALEQVAALARDWFLRHLAGGEGVG
jgi:putative phosphoribosyl transferase